MKADVQWKATPKLISEGVTMAWPCQLRNHTQRSAYRLELLLKSLRRAAAKKVTCSLMTCLLHLRRRWIRSLSCPLTCVKAVWICHPSARLWLFTKLQSWESVTSESSLTSRSPRTLSMEPNLSLWSRVAAIKSTMKASSFLPNQKKAWRNWQKRTQSSQKKRESLLIWCPRLLRRIWCLNKIIRKGLLRATRPLRSHQESVWST